MRQLVRVLLIIALSISFSFANTLEEKLFEAVEKGDLAKVKYLLSRGANLYSKNKFGDSPMDYAVTFNHIHIIKYFIRKGVSIKCTDGSCMYLYLAASDSYATTKFLINRGADVNAAEKKSKLTPLIGAAGNNKVKIANLLLSRGAVKTINAQDRYGYTALMISASRGYLEVVIVLLNKKASINIQDSNGRTALFWAARNGKLEAVKLLVQNGADINIMGSDTRPGKKGKMYTPQGIAKRWRHQKVAQYLEALR